MEEKTKNKIEIDGVSFAGSLDPAADIEARDKKSLTPKSRKKYWFWKLPYKKFRNQGPESWKGLTMSERLIFVALNTYSDPSGLSFPSLRILSEQLEASKTTILKNIRSLEKKGFLKIERSETRKWGHFAHNVYRILK